MTSAAAAIQERPHATRDAGVVVLRVVPPSAERGRSASTASAALIVGTIVLVQASWLGLLGVVAYRLIG